MNTLYYGDNLDILRNRDWFPNGAVDLIYLDPPFNSKRAYNVIFKDKEGKYPPSQIEAFDDTWQWSDETAEAMWELSKPPYPAELYRTLEAFRVALGTSDMMAYLVMMAIRLVELKRVLKDTGSIYLHCDPTASHYLKIIMDQIFGVKNYHAEITWLSTTDTGSSKARAKTFPRMYDVLLFYSKSNNYFFEPLFRPYREKYIENKFKYSDEKGKFRWQVLKTYSEETFNRLKKENKLKKTAESKYYYYKQYLSDSKGVITGNLWDDIMPLGPSSKERLGYPTQKPIALLERIIKASSNEDDIVLDPFCGCGTAVAAAEKLGRKWLGIDITILAINLIEKRMKDHFPDVKFEIEGIPNSVASAKKMASTRQGKFLFEQWFVTTLGGQPFKSSGGGDSGIDGFMNFRDINNKPHTIIVSVKGGGYTPGMVRDLARVVERENAAMGILLALNEPTKGMLSEAASAGRYQMPEVSRTYPKIQIFTIEDYFKGIRPDLPDTSETLKKAKRIKKDSEKPQKLL
ncbi:site-specific DNA-methyltransferase [bacterium]|nr:site-specific DNA-methyltransferase [bacterium]